MRCTKCNYALWNTPAGPCPECGEPFKPSDFRFRQNAIAFRCPSCQQDYYGTDAKGHLAPAEFDCVTCGRRLTMDEMLILPTEGVDERKTGQEANAWVADDGVSRRWRFPRTIMQGAFSPHIVVERTPETSGIWPALSFVFLVLACMAVLGLLPFLFIMVMPFLTGGGGGVRAAASIVGVVLALFTVPALLFIVWVLTTHLWLVVGASERPKFRRTVQSMSYTSGPVMLIGVPCIGPYLLWLAAIPWWITTAIIGLRVGTRAPIWRCVVGGLFFPAVVAIALIGGYIGLLSFLFSSTGPIAMATANTNGAAGVLAFDAAIGVRSGALPPAHAAELMIGATIDPGAFAIRGSNTNPFTLQIANTDALAFSMMTAGEQAGVVQAAIDAMPEGTIAHRFGDFVFVTDAAPPGSDPSQVASLWRVIGALDPELNPGGWSVIWISTPTGTVSYDQTTFDAALALQNRIRASLNMPPLPHPDDITHDSPAVAD